MLELKLIEDAHQADHERRCRISDAWRAYEGDLPKPLKVAPGDPDDNTRIPLGQVVVNKGVSFLFPDGVKFELEKEEGAADVESEAERWLDKAWKANRLGSTLLMLGINGGVCGDAFLRLLPGREYPRVVVLDPQCCFVIWDDDDITQEKAFIIRQNAGAKDGAYIKQQVIQNEGTPEAPRWTITEYVNKLAGRWSIATVWEQVGPAIVWRWPWAPVLHCQNLPCPNSYYGYSDLEPAVNALNQAVNFVETNTGRIIRFHAHPQTVVTGSPAPRQPANPVAAAAAGQAGKLEIGPNKVWYLAQGDVKNLEMQSDLASSQAHAERLLDRYYETTRVPRVATGKLDSIGQLSGLALKLLFGPLLEKTEQKRPLYGEMLQECCARMLEMGGKGEGASIVTHWPSPLPSNKKEEADTASVLNDLGVSKHTLIQELGYDPETEQQKREAERETDMQLGDRLLQDFNAGRNGASPDVQQQQQRNPSPPAPNR